VVYAIGFVKEEEGGEQNRGLEEDASRRVLASGRFPLLRGC